MTGFQPFLLIHSFNISSSSASIYAPLAFSFFVLISSSSRTRPPWHFRPCLLEILHIICMVTHPCHDCYPVHYCLYCTMLLVGQCEAAASSRCPMRNVHVGLWSSLSLALSLEFIYACFRLPCMRVRCTSNLWSTFCIRAQDRRIRVRVMDNEWIRYRYCILPLAI